MAELPDDIVELVAAEKYLQRSPVWDANSDDRYYVFSAPLVIVDNPISGFQLRAKSSKRHVDRDALCQLEYAPTVRGTIPLWRIQWRPFERHQNKTWGPPGFELDTIVGTHEHRFEDNWMTETLELRPGNLPAARPLERDPATLSDFLAICGRQFRIRDMTRIEPPLISQDIFWQTND